MKKLLKDVKTLSIIGMQKNVGKTTVLNYILKELSDRKIGLTSIGRDGEKEDSVYSVKKPSIFVKKGTVIATTGEAINNTSLDVLLIKKTNISTPMGDVEIVLALEDGFIDLAGPSFNTQINEVLRDILGEGVDLFIVDGAFSRKQMASNHMLESTILVTGASYSTDVEKVVNDTYTTYKLLTLPKLNCDRVNDLINNYAVSIIDRNNNEYTFDLESALGSKEKIVSKLDKTSKYLIINGALTHELVNHLVKYRQKLDRLTIVLKDGTKAFLDYDLYINLQKINIDLKVINRINLICLTYNPYSPLGYEFKDHIFRKMLEDKIDLPIFNVLKIKEGKS
ncbi:hypothetical protein RJG79_12435 [Mycoplasmatota bacterium WC44]